MEGYLKGSCGFRIPYPKFQNQELCEFQKFNFEFCNICMYILRCLELNPKILSVCLWNVAGGDCVGVLSVAVHCHLCLYVWSLEVDTECLPLSLPALVLRFWRLPGHGALRIFV